METLITHYRAEIKKEKAMADEVREACRKMGLEIDRLEVENEQLRTPQGGVMEQRQKPERFEPTDVHSIDSTWGIFNALETISAQLDYGLDRLDYLIEQNKEPDHD